MKPVVIAAIAALGLTPLAANANLISSFAQTSNSNTVTATNNGAGVTTIDISGATVNLGGGILGSIPGATFDLTATSTDTAVLVTPTEVLQHYSGTFCISSGAGCTGNFLQGTFADAAFGANGGPGLDVNVNNPPESLTLTSNVLPANELNPPSSFNLTFVNLLPALGITMGSISDFTASFTGDVSASTTSIPEPGSFAVLGVGLIGLGLVARRKKFV